MNNPISVGIDVGKDELVACIRRTDGTSTSPTSFLNNTVGLKALLDIYTSITTGSTIGRRPAPPNIIYSIGLVRRCAST